MVLKPKLTYAAGRNPHEDFSEDEINSRNPNILQGSSRLQEDGGARRSSMVSTKPKTRRNRSLTTGRHTVGGAPPPGAFFFCSITRQPRRMVSIRTNQCLGS
jgi:hypothetical protein